MTRLTQKGQGSPMTVFSQSTDSSLDTLLGARFDAQDGREFALAKVGASAIGQGLLVQSPAVTAAHQDMATATTAIGSKTIVVTLGAGAVTANQYAGGYLQILTGTGAGQNLEVASHLAHAGSGTLTINLADALQVATSVSDTKSSLIPNQYNAVIVSAGTSKVVGATAYPTTAANYAFLQTKGTNAIVSSSGVAATGLRVGIGATAGWAAVATAGAGTVGTAIQLGVATKYTAVWLDL